MDELASAFAQAFWKNQERAVAAKSQNPIAAKQALYVKDGRTDKVSLAQGMVFNDKDRVRVYDPKANAWYDSVEEAIRAGCDVDRCEIFKNKEGKIYHSPAVFVAHRRALDRFRRDQFGDDPSANPCAYGTPTGALYQEACLFDGQDIYGQGQYDGQRTISFQTLGMASGYRHLTLPVLDSIRESLGLPLIENIAMGTNSYEAYPAAFDQKKIRRYRYMTENGEFDFESFKKAAEILDPQKTIFLFDMSTGNNFAGVKRTQKDNENIAGILIDKKLYSEHDIAYPNFDPAFDPQWELHRILQKKGAPHGVQSSRGKKDKYASRLAFHHIYLGTPEQKSEIFSHLVSENRDRFLAMPDTWTYLVEIARDPVLKKAHDADNRAFVDIVNASRTSLADALGWDWMKSRSGMFDMVRISHEGIEIMARDFAVYAVPTRDQNLLGPDGEPVGVTRIKHGMPKSKIPKVAEALRRAAQKYPSDKGGVNPEIIVQRT